MKAVSPSLNYFMKLLRRYDAFTRVIDFLIETNEMILWIYFWALARNSFKVAILQYNNI